MQAFMTAAAAVPTATATATVTATATATSPATDAPTATSVATAGGVLPPELDPDMLTTPIETNDVLGNALAAHCTAMGAELMARETIATPDAHPTNTPGLSPPHMHGALCAPDPPSPVTPVVRGSPDSRLHS